MKDPKDEKAVTGRAERDLMEDTETSGPVPPFAEGEIRPLPERHVPPSFSDVPAGGLVRVGRDRVFAAEGPEGWALFHAPGGAVLEGPVRVATRARDLPRWERRRRALRVAGHLADACSLVLATALLAATLVMPAESGAVTLIFFAMWLAFGISLMTPLMIRKVSAPLEAR